MRNLLAAAALVAAGLPGVAYAKQMSYAFVQLNGIFDAEATLEDLPPPFTALNGASVDGDGIGFEAGWIYGPYAFTDVRYDDYEFDGGLDFQEAAVRLGVRGKMPLQDPMRLDAYGAISVEHVEVEGDTQTGPGLAAGIRFAPIQYLELSGEFSYADLDTDNAQFLTAGIQWNIADNFALNLRYRTGEYESDFGTLDVDSLRLGIRLQWGGG